MIESLTQPSHLLVIVLVLIFFAAVIEYFVTTDAPMMPNVAKLA